MTLQKVENLFGERRGLQSRKRKKRRIIWFSIVNAEKIRILGMCEGAQMMLYLVMMRQMAGLCSVVLYSEDSL